MCYVRQMTYYGDIIWTEYREVCVQVDDFRHREYNIIVILFHTVYYNIHKYFPFYQNKLSQFCDNLVMIVVCDSTFLFYLSLSLTRCCVKHELCEQCVFESLLYITVYP